MIKNNTKELNTMTKIINELPIIKIDMNVLWKLIIENIGDVLSIIGVISIMLGIILWVIANDLCYSSNALASMNEIESTWQRWLYKFSFWQVFFIAPCILTIGFLYFLWSLKILILI